MPCACASSCALIPEDAADPLALLGLRAGHHDPLRRGHPDLVILNGSWWTGRRDLVRLNGSLCSGLLDLIILNRLWRPGRLARFAVTGPHHRDRLSQHCALIEGVQCFFEPSLEGRRKALIERPFLVVNMLLSDSAHGLLKHQLEDGSVGASYSAIIPFHRRVRDAKLVSGICLRKPHAQSPSLEGRESLSHGATYSWFVATATLALDSSQR